MESYSRLLDYVHSFPYAVLWFYSIRWPGSTYFRPKYEKMARYYWHEKVVFLKVSIDESYDIQQQFQFDWVPYMFIFKDGDIYDRVRGGDPNRLAQIIQQILSILDNK